MLNYRLKAARESRGLSQRELAQLCGFGEKQIWRYESGGSDPSSEHLTIIAKVLEVSTDYLLGLVDEPHRVFVSDEKLTPVERKLIDAVRRGRIIEALKTFTELTNDDKQSLVAI